MSERPGRRAAPRPRGAVVVSVTADARSVLRGDELLVGGMVWTVRDITGAPGGCKWLEFANGERMLIRPYTVFWVSRRTSGVPG
ncbi:hypothetical protein RM780_24275 [Streptomyces sp. DSM 44917]|uniref:DUF3148 domain-containing protein n=1 Tax=Streptomyces boetiae TaxID=3075541 RepID=A0ABU2LEY4_9ACTN|nr:hypothetical protein [Streptomyces sp. DSM 44917]MDT0310046.1 hypothetical protein [Streptomyces sp. DSM 44917]